MRVLLLTITLYAPWVHSLKEKRMELKSLLTRLHSRFNVSACETDAQDLHQTLVISVAAIVADAAQGDSVAQNVLSFVEGNTEAEVTRVERQML